MNSLKTNNSNFDGTIDDTPINNLPKKQVIQQQRPVSQQSQVNVNPNYRPTYNEQQKMKPEKPLASSTYNLENNIIKNNYKKIESVINNEQPEIKAFNKSSKLEKDVYYSEKNLKFPGFEKV